jgi:hypothetical protein
MIARCVEATAMPRTRGLQNPRENRVFLPATADPAHQESANLPDEPRARDEYRRKEKATDLSRGFRIAQCTNGDVA